MSLCSMLQTIAPPSLPTSTNAESTEEKICMCIFRGHSMNFHAGQDPFQDYRFFREQGKPGALMSPVMGTPRHLGDQNIF